MCMYKEDIQSATKSSEHIKRFKRTRLVCWRKEYQRIARNVLDKETGIIICVSVMEEFLQLKDPMSVGMHLLHNKGEGCLNTQCILL